MDRSLGRLGLLVVVLVVDGGRAFAAGRAPGADGVDLGDLFEGDFVDDAGSRGGARGGGFGDWLAEALRPPGGGLETGLDGGAVVGFRFLRGVC